MEPWTIAFSPSWHLPQYKHTRGLSSGVHSCTLSLVPASTLIWNYKPFVHCNHVEAISQSVGNFSKGLEYPNICHWFVCYIFPTVIRQLNVTADILVPTIVYKLGSNRSTFGLYHSPTIQYLGEEHLPYAIIAIFILITLVFTPTAILIIYPFQCFQRVISYITLNWHFLHAFVNSFQGCYKDGTEPGTFDCRWFAVLLLLIRLALFILFSMTLSIIFLCTLS